MKTMPRASDDVEAYILHERLGQLIVKLELPIGFMSGGDETILLVPMPLQF